MRKEYGFNTCFTYFFTQISIRYWYCPIHNEVTTKNWKGKIKKLHELLSPRRQRDSKTMNLFFKNFMLLFKTHTKILQINPAVKRKLIATYYLQRSLESNTIVWSTIQQLKNRKTMKRSICWYFLYVWTALVASISSSRIRKNTSFVVL